MNYLYNRQSSFFPNKRGKIAKFRQKLQKVIKYLIKIFVQSLPDCIKPVWGNCWTCHINTPKINIFRQSNDGTPYLFLNLHQKQSSKIGLETRPQINLWGLGIMTLPIISIVHSNGK